MLLREEKTQRKSRQCATGHICINNNKKIPAVAIYDTDNNWGVYEHRIKTVCDKLNIKFFWVIARNSKSENIITKNFYKLSEGHNK